MIVPSVHYLLLLPSFTDLCIWIWLICCFYTQFVRNNIGADGAKALAQALQTNSTLITLGLVVGWKVFGCIRDH